MIRLLVSIVATFLDINFVRVSKHTMWLVEGCKVRLIVKVARPKLPKVWYMSVKGCPDDWNTGE